ncbi:TPM domain-containing protein [Carboxylicivirga linearis]|uniref:TPM domain-containing protein n=1 Tax=Carboxylicivirga linearis TaxID=1628157 RepID=A0ABS5JV48_9BACT|nr:TPM domain-containing protein [Carboxylicivirga linearis]MBS2098775.1 TPM domain-containing protein [Carboxylicivirga linearis]
MKSHSITTKLFLSVLLFLSFNVASANSIFDKPTPDRFINDYANLLKEHQIELLENKVKEVEYNTSMQIAIVTVKNLEGMRPSAFTHKLANQWGVGQKYKDNGILIMIKPKYSNEKGEVYIAVGTGLESTITNNKAQQIVNSDLIPNLKQGYFYEGLDEAIDTISSYSASSKSKAFIESIFSQELIITLLVILLLLPPFYLVYLKNRRVSDEYSHFYVKDGYDEKNLIEQVTLMEERYNKKYSKFKKLIIRYNSITKGNLFKYSDKIDNQMFCYLLNGQNRYKLFWEMIDPFFLFICGLLCTLALIANLIILIYYGWVGLIIGLTAIALIVYALISFLNSFVEMEQFALRKNKKYLGGVGVSLFAINALLKKNIKTTYNPTTNSYSYIPHVVFYTAASGSGFGGGISGFGGGGFGGGGFSGGGAGGSW